MTKEANNTQIENKITDRILFDKCQARKLALISKEEFEIWLKDNIVVKPYIGIELKYATADIVNLVFSSNYNLGTNDVADIFNGKDVEYDMYDIMQGYDITKLIFILPRYIDICIGNEYKNAETYDLVHESGLFNYVLSYCEKDYIDFNKKIDRITGIEYLPMMSIISQTVGTLPTQAKLLEVINTIDNSQDTLDKVTKFNEMNDPLMTEISNVVKMDAVKDAMKKGKKATTNKKKK